MLTGVQIKAARTALKWSADVLASRSDIASKTVRRIETSDGIPNTTAATLSKIQAALEAAGIEFIGTPGDGPGIRVRQP